MTPNEVQLAKLVLWLGGETLLAVIGGVMLWRKLYRRFPVFSLYIASQLVRFVILFSAFEAGNKALYRAAFLRLELVDAVLSFAVIYELFDLTFQEYEGLRQLGWMLLRWASVVLVVLALVVAFSQPPTDTEPYLQGLFAFEMGISVVRGGLLFLLFVLHAGLGLNWGRHAFGIAAGFGLIAVIALAAYTLRHYYGQGSTTVLSLINSAVYDSAVVVWLAALLRTDAVRLRRPLKPPKWKVEQWNRALLELLQR